MKQWRTCDLAVSGRPSKRECDIQDQEARGSKQGWLASWHRLAKASQGGRITAVTLQRSSSGSDILCSHLILGVVFPHQACRFQCTFALSNVLVCLGVRAGHDLSEQMLQGSSRKLINPQWTAGSASWHNFGASTGATSTL